MKIVKEENRAGYLESFKALYREKKYPHALIIASKYPELKQTSEYANMQEHFQTLLKVAALHLKKGERYKAQELIGEYSRVEEKRVVVKLLLAFGEEFLSFLKAVHEWDLEYVFGTLRLHPDFENVPSFIVLKRQMQKRLLLLEKKMDGMEFEADFSPLWQWEAFLPEAVELRKKLADLKKLHALYEEERWAECYDMLEESVSVQNSLLARLLQRHWYISFERAKVWAERGDIERVSKELELFSDSASKKEQIERLLYFASKRRIADLIERGVFTEAERLLFVTADRFGAKADLIELSERYYQRSGVKVVFG